jgi:hypothetical protein
MSVFVASFIQHQMRMRRIILSSVACPFLLDCSTIYHKRNDYRKKKLNVNMLSNFLLNLCLKHLVRYYDKCA